MVNQPNGFTQILPWTAVDMPINSGSFPIAQQGKRRKVGVAFSRSFRGCTLATFLQ